MIDEYKAAGVPPRNVWAQSFSLEDVLYWINHEPAFGRQAVFLATPTSPVTCRRRPSSSPIPHGA
jgi:glycerophosphoryl diester phosphodiesterase